MVNDFSFYNPTRIHFGKDALSHLEEELVNYGPKVMLAYGGGSIKRNGIYDKVVAILKKAGKTIYECAGIMPNPTLNKLKEGAKIVHDNNVDLILAVGGGSVIDCAKGISVAAYAEGDFFTRYWMKGEKITNKIVPVGSILTMVGTGSEMNGGSVITDEEHLIKKGHVFGPEVFPKFSILNPEYTYTVSEYQMVSGIFDCLSHLMEQYFAGDDDNVSDYMIEALYRSVVHAALVAIKDPHNYEARSNLMWDSTLALNTLVGLDKLSDWMAHGIEHQISAFTNCAHGMGLAAISIPLYKHCYKAGLPRFVRFATRIWDVDTNGKSDEEVALEGLNRLSKFMDDIHLVRHLKDLGASEAMLPEIAQTIDEGSCYKYLTKQEILEILKEAF